jgi:hypothetical protein
MDPSGKAILAATSKRSGADWSIVSAAGCMTCFDINSLNLNRSRQSFGSHAQIAGLFRSVATYIIIARLRELGTNLPGRSLSQILARKGQAILLGVPRGDSEHPSDARRSAGTSAGYRNNPTSRNMVGSCAAPIRWAATHRSPLCTRNAKEIASATRSFMSGRLSISFDDFAEGSSAFDRVLLRSVRSAETGVRFP